MKSLMILPVLAVAIGSCEKPKTEAPKLEPQVTVASSRVIQGPFSDAENLDAVRMGQGQFWTIWLHDRKECRVQMQVGPTRVVVDKADPRACGRLEDGKRAVEKK
jgi:hypothetical protein